MALIKLNNQSYTSGSAFLPSGSVLQVVSTSFSTQFSTSSSSDTDSGLNASITPSSTSNKVLILLTTMLRAQSASNGTTFVYQKLWRGAVGSGTQIHDGYPIIGVINTTDTRGVGAVTLLDSPNTTSSVTYRVSLNAAYSGTNVYMNQVTDPSIMTLMEIKG